MTGDTPLPVPAELLEPAAAVPMAPQIGGVLRDYHQVESSGFDRPFTAGARIALAGRVWLDRHDRRGQLGSRAHTITAAARARATTTITTSIAVR